MARESQTALAGESQGNLGLVQSRVGAPTETKHCCQLGNEKLARLALRGSVIF